MTREWGLPMVRALIDNPETNEPRGSQMKGQTMRSLKTLSFLAPIALGIGISLSPSTTPTVDAPAAESHPESMSLGESLNQSLIIGSDLNGADNPFVQPQNPALAGGGRDQTMKFMDILFGSPWAVNVINGRLGDDLMVGGGFTDVFVGGLEHFNPSNRDKAFGGAGDDFFLWKPGDGSDRFDGGPGLDTVILGLIAEPDQWGNPVFQVVNDQQAGDLFLDPTYCLPKVDVTNSPGFCEIIDQSYSASASQELADLDVDHLVRFFIRGINNAFIAGTQTTDNGLRVTLHLRNVEYLVCTSQAGGAIVAYDLRQYPAQVVPLSQLPAGTSLLVQ